MKYAFGDLISDIARPFAIGVVIAGVISFVVPEDLWALSSSHPFISMLIMLIAGIPMYVCATSSTPIAAALILKGLNPGAALVFLLAGPATNAATMNVVKNVFNTRALVIYLSMIAACSLCMGFFVDWLYAFLGLQSSVTVGQSSQIIPYPLQLAGALILGALMIFSMMKNRHQDHCHQSSGLRCNDPAAG